MELIEMYIYKMTDKSNSVLYVGKTIHLKKRLSQHKSTKKWFNEVYKIQYAKCDNETDMNIYEVYYINILSPKYNISENYKKQPTFKLKDLDFKEFKGKNYIIELKAVSDSDLGKLLRLYVNFKNSEFSFKDVENVLLNTNVRTIKNFLSRLTTKKYILRIKYQIYKINTNKL